MSTKRTERTVAKSQLDRICDRAIMAIGVFTIGIFLTMLSVMPIIQSNNTTVITFTALGILGILWGTILGMTVVDRFRVYAKNMSGNKPTIKSDSA